MTRLAELDPATRERFEAVLAAQREAIIDAGTDWIIASSEDLRGRRPRGETRALVAREFDIYCELLSSGDTRARDEFIEHTTALRASSKFRISTLLSGFLCFKQGVEQVLRERGELEPAQHLALVRLLDQLYYETAFHMADVYSHKLLTVIRETQDQLMQREKLAALGGLVAGIAHEINTPMGVALTGASLVQDRLTALEQAYASGELRKSHLVEFMTDARSGLDVTLTNLTRASDLITSFKQVAVDQTHSTPRRVHLASYLRDVMASLTPMHRRSGHRIELELDESLELDTHPGALSQIVTNLLQNALVHAYDEGVIGRIVLGLRAVAGAIELSLTDEGRGMSADQQRRVFEPFYTTRRGTGGSGLGMHVVHNLVTQRLDGTVRIESAPGRGTRVVVRLPTTPGKA